MCCKVEFECCINKINHITEKNCQNVRRKEKHRKIIPKQKPSNTQREADMMCSLASSLVQPYHQLPYDYWPLTHTPPFPPAVEIICLWFMHYIF